MENAVLVTYNQSLAAVNKVMGTDFATTKDSYTVSKGGTKQDIGTVTAVATDSNTVMLPVSGIHDDLTNAKITVTAKGVGSMDYVLNAPVPVSATAISPTQIAITFSDSLKTSGESVQFTITGSGLGTPDVSAVSLNSTAPLLFTVTADKMTGLLSTVTDAKISYDSSKGGTKLTGMTGTAVASFSQKIDTSSLKPLTATIKTNEANSATALTLEFSEPLYVNGKAVQNDAEIKDAFTGTGGVKIGSAKVGQDLKTVTFTLTGSTVDDTITGTTITTANKVPWEQMVTYTSTNNWAMKTTKP
jgi:hypothetical protein